MKDILFLHGALGVAEDLRPLMTYFDNKGYRTLTFNFSGHGQTTAWPDEFRIDLFARDLDKFLKDHSLTNPIVVGHSMGGYVALYHKANFEDSSIGPIFTYGTKFNWSRPAVAKELPMLDPDYLTAKLPQFCRILQEKHGERWKTLLRSTAHLMQNLEKLDGLSKEDLHSIDVPVTLIRGDQDRMVTSEETNLASSRIPRSSIKTLAHSKHELERTNLKELADLIIKSLD
jgi:pimeloyl-ACP methyl ester carboxylesterase